MPLVNYVFTSMFGVHREWLHNIGIGDQTAVVHDNEDPDDGAVPVHHGDGAKKRYVLSRAALPVIRAALGAQLIILQYAKVAIQGYLNHFLGNVDIVNSREVWAVLNLKPGFLALLEDPFDSNLLDIIIFNVLPASGEDGEDQISCSNRITRLRTTSYANVQGWISAINDAALNPPEGWCHPHRYGSFAPPRGLIEDGSQAQWFVDGQAAFEAIASSMETAKSEVQPSHCKVTL
ncbi:hypothetical protein Vadar_010582 [Vaccinium darrowii]|uniref:Uncharacterized protein n=1 Tax=Vaccinium darrowii TaxID=229202 RepID=A0ACB7YKL5_9ERIC|nr:hypothetical protein Vadar_010582 [Vaccinium darrowii]